VAVNDREVTVVQECVFCAIAAKDAPVRLVCETEALLCFFPLEPEVLGHTLIVSKGHHADMRDCPASFGAEVFEAAQFLATLYGKTLGATGFNLMNASGGDAEQSVDHLHFHYLPRFPGDGFSTWPKLPEFRTDLDALLARVTSQLRVPNDPTLDPSPQGD
jgi:histidine triad (HIT) family protein